MTTTMSPTPEPDEDPFEQVERQLDWVEQLENLRVRHDSLARRPAPPSATWTPCAMRCASWPGRQTYEDLKLLYGDELADLVDAVRKPDGDDWERHHQAGPAAGRLTIKAPLPPVGRGSSGEGGTLPCSADA